MTDMTAEQALDVLADNMRDKDAGVIRLGIRDNAKTRQAIAWLLENRAALSAPRVPAGFHIKRGEDGDIRIAYGDLEQDGRIRLGDTKSVAVWLGPSPIETEHALLYKLAAALLAASPEPVAPDAPSIDDYVNLCAAMYQAAGARNLPVRFLDALSEAQSGEPFAHLIQGLLPVSEDEEGAFCPDAKNYESMFMQAIKSIAEISVAVGVPDDEAEAANGNDEILHYIGLIKSERDDLRAEVEALKLDLHNTHVDRALAESEVEALREWQRKHRHAAERDIVEMACMKEDHQRYQLLRNDAERCEVAVQICDSGMQQILCGDELDMALDKLIADDLAARLREGGA